MNSLAETIELFDTHAHLDDDQFRDNLDDMLQRAAQAGVTTILAVGTTAASSAAAVAIAERWPQVYAAVGIQPNYGIEATPDEWPRIAELASHPKVRAIGETGLDQYWDFTPFQLQRELFERHLRLAQQFELPVIVHMRDCGETTVEVLRSASQTGPVHGVMHSFTGDRKTADQCLDLGLHISFAGMVTFQKSDALRAIAADVPADRILVETDSPYLTPHPYRGQRPNEPARIVHTAECLAKVRGMTLAAFAKQTTANARTLFSCP